MKNSSGYSQYKNSSLKTSYNNIRTKNSLESSTIGPSPSSLASSKRDISRISEQGDLDLENEHTLSKIKQGGTKFFSRIKKQRKKTNIHKGKDSRTIGSRKMNKEQLKKEFKNMGLAQMISVYKSLIISGLEECYQEYTNCFKDAVDFTDIIPKRKQDITNKMFNISQN